MINLSTKFEISIISTHYEDMEGDTKYGKMEKWSSLG